MRTHSYGRTNFDPNFIECGIDDYLFAKALAPSRSVWEANLTNALSPWSINWGKKIYDERRWGNWRNELNRGVQNVQDRLPVMLGLSPWDDLLKEARHEHHRDFILV